MKYKNISQEDINISGFKTIKSGENFDYDKNLIDERFEEFKEVIIDENIIEKKKSKK